MATISTQHLQLNPQNLKNLDGLDPTWFPEAMSWSQRANQLDTTTLEDAMRAAAHEKAMDPLRLSKQQADIDSTIASTGLTKANTSEQEMKNKVYGANIDRRIESEGKDLLLKAEQADFDRFELDVYSGLKSQDPQVRKASQAMLPMLKFAQQERIKADQQLRVQGSANANAKSMQEARFKHEKEMEDARIAAGKYSNKNSVKTIEQTIAGAKTAAQRHQALIDAATVAAQSGNEELAESYRARAEEIRPQAEAELRMLQKPGEVDLSKPRVQGEPVPVTPQSSIAPNRAKPGSRENPIKLD